MLENLATLHDPNDGSLQIHLAVLFHRLVRVLDLLRSLFLDRAGDAELCALVSVLQVETDGRCLCRRLKCK